MQVDVSVVIAVRNEELHIESAVGSVLAQTDIALELVIVDDGSSDRTYELVDKISKGDSRVVLYRNPRKGKCSAFNLGVSIARGRFICIFAGDDLMPRGSLSARYAAISESSDEEYVVGLSKLITMSEIRRFDGHLIPRAKNKGALSGVSPLMNRRVAQIIFPTPENLPNEDTWMELAITYMPGWRVVHSDVICCQWRVHSGNSINLTLPFKEFNQRMSIRMDALELFMEKFGAQLTVSDRGILRARIEMERSRRCGDWVRVLRTPVAIVDRLRALSMTNELMYAIRVRLFGLLSGW
jgi:hypothetical protein